MKEFEGLKVPHEGLHCNGKDSDCLGLMCDQCIFGVYEENIIKYAKYILTHKTPITENILPFGMLIKEKQEEMKKAWNGKSGTASNIQRLVIVGEPIWENISPIWYVDFVYRLDPSWIGPVKKYREMNLNEIWEKRNEWEFELFQCLKKPLVIKQKIVNENNSIDQIFLFYLDTDEKLILYVDSDINIIKYRPIGSTEEFKPLPKVEDAPQFKGVL